MVHVTEVPTLLDVRKSITGSRGAYKIKDGDCLYRISVNHGEGGMDTFDAPAYKKGVHSPG